MFFNQPVFRWFHCLTGENLDKSFTCSGNYIEQGEPDILYKNICCEDNELLFSFFGRSYNEAIWFCESDFHILCLLARKGILQIEQAAIKADTTYLATDYSLIRKNICELCLASRCLLVSPENDFDDIKSHMKPAIKILFEDMKQLKDLPDYIIFNSKQNENTNQLASYNYLHLSIDIYWLSLTSEHYMEEDFAVKLDIFEKNLNTIISNLIYVSFKKFEIIKSYTNLSKLSPFLCPCLKEIWLLIQLYVEKLHSQNFCKDFWHYFNTTIKEEINFKNCTNSKDAVCCLWLLYHVARIQGCKSNGAYIGTTHSRVISNYSLVEQCLKIVTNVNSTQIDEYLMCSCLNLLASLQMNWWKKDATFDLLQLLWEYFYKKINMSFLNDPETFLNNSQKYDYSELTETILQYNLECPPNCVTSYDIFLSLLGKYLTVNPSHWPKLKGRIYSKLSPPKLGALTDVGLHNLIQLFFVLSYTVNFTELTDKLQSLLNQLPSSKSDGNSIIWSAHISLLSMKANRGISLNGIGVIDISTPFLLAVQTASSDRSQSHLMKIYIEGLKKIVENDTDLKCHEFSLFGGWINKYLQWCPHSDARFLLDILKYLIEKIHSLGGPPEWWDVVENNVVASIIQLSSILDAPVQVADLSATLIWADGKRFRNLLEHMTSDSVGTNLSIKFLTSLLDQNRSVDLLPEHQTLVTQAWIRIAVLNTDKSELTELTTLISRLPSWASLYSGALSEDDDPLYEVIRSAGLRMREAKSVQDTAAVKRWFETYFGRMDRWVGPVISGAEKGENAQLVLRVYSAAAVLYLNCAPALYVKNKNTCIFYRLTSTLLLPSSILMNKRPSNIILAALKRTWHLFVRGIARLDYKTDTYVERTLKDMTIRYVPHLNDSTSPIIRCLDNEFEDSASSFILDKLAVNLISCKSKHNHEHSLLALKLVLEMSKKQTKIDILSRTILPSLFEQLMFSDDATAKNIVVEIIENFKASQFYSHIKEIFKHSILIIIDKHLAFHSTNVFRFLELIANVLPNEIQDIFLSLNDAVKKVECMRGVGYDKTLRKGLQRIQEIMNQR